MFTWKILEAFSDNDKLISVRYHLICADDNNSVETEGNHVFEPNTVNKPFNEITEEDIISWIEKDTIQGDVSHIKLGIQNQLNSLETVKKVSLPWEETFTPGS